MFHCEIIKVSFLISKVRYTFFTRIRVILLQWHMNILVFKRLPRKVVYIFFKSTREFGAGKVFKRYVTRFFSYDNGEYYIYLRTLPYDATRNILIILRFNLLFLD